jgi:hypothetical protein
VPYSIGGAAVTYTLTFPDNVSEHFTTDSICGVLTLRSYSDKDSTLSSLDDVLAVTGTDSTGVMITIENSDYWFISEDSAFTLKLDYNWGQYDVNYEYLYQIDLVYTEPCSAQTSWLVLNDIEATTHQAIIITEALDTTIAFTYNSTDCSDPCDTLSEEELKVYNGECGGTCGSVVGSLTFPVGSPALLENYVTVDGDSILVAKNTNYEVFGEWEIILTISYSNPDCADSTQSKYFTLRIECDTNDAYILDLTTTESTALEFYFIKDSTV